MKLINKTSVPNELLTQILRCAAVSIGVRHSKVVVRVSMGRIRGFAYRCHAVRWTGRWTNTDCGAIKLWIRKPISELNAVDIALHFYETAQHEWGHIKDYQSFPHLPWSRRVNGRRPRWHDRPEEERAMMYVKDARPMPVDDFLFDLATKLQHLTPP